MKNDTLSRIWGDIFEAFPRLFVDLLLYRIFPIILEETCLNQMYTFILFTYI